MECPLLDPMKCGFGERLSLAVQAHVVSCVLCTTEVMELFTLLHQVPIGEELAVAYEAMSSRHMAARSTRPAPSISYKPTRRCLCSLMR
jgi:hypothetical protein